MKDLEYARLSGITIPEGLLTAVDEAQTRLETIRAKKEELAARKLGAQDKIRETVRMEASAMVGDGADGSKLAKRREKAEGAISSATALMGEMRKIEAKAENELSQAGAAVESHINDALVTGRAEMKRQLDAAMSQRGRQLGSLRAGERPWSTPPEESSQSRIAVADPKKFGGSTRVLADMLKARRSADTGDRGLPTEPAGIGELKPTM